MLHFLNLLNALIITPILSLLHIPRLAMHSMILMPLYILNAKRKLLQSSRSHGIVQS